MTILNSKRVKIFLAWLIALTVLLPSIVMGADINLPQGINAIAYVIKSERDGFWEKSLIVKFPERRRVLSTNDGFVDAMSVVNHSAHPELWKKVCHDMKTKEEVGGKVYSRIIKKRIAGEFGIRSEDIAKMATAVDMDNIAIKTKIHEPFTITALVTAGARTNALRTGLDEGRYIEGEESKGTVNILILTNTRLTDGAMARAIVTATEAKTAAFEDLKVPSSYTKNAQATGTGTDTVTVVSGTGGPKVTYTGGHSKIGELIGKAVYEATMKALEKQNGFEKPDIDVVSGAE